MAAHFRHRVDPDYHQIEPLDQKAYTRTQLLIGALSSRKDRIDLHVTLFELILLVIFISVLSSLICRIVWIFSRYLVTGISDNDGDDSQLGKRFKQLEESAEKIPELFGKLGVSAGRTLDQLRIRSMNTTRRQSEPARSRQPWERASVPSIYVEGGRGVLYEDMQRGYDDKRRGDYDGDETEKSCQGSGRQDNVDKYYESWGLQNRRRSGYCFVPNQVDERLHEDEIQDRRNSCSQELLRRKY